MTGFSVPWYVLRRFRGTEKQADGIAVPRNRCATTFAEPLQPTACLQRARYGLAAADVAGLGTIEDELERLQRWRVIGINLNRRLPVEPIEADTFDGNDRPRICGYLGFLHKFVLPAAVPPSITMYVMDEWFMRFVSFLAVDRGCSQAYLRSHITTATYVLDFLKSTLAADNEVAQVDALIEAYTRVHRQASLFRKWERKRHWRDAVPRGPLAPLDAGHVRGRACQATRHHHSSGRWSVAGLRRPCPGQPGAVPVSLSWTRGSWEPRYRLYAPCPAAPPAHPATTCLARSRGVKVMAAVYGKDWHLEMLEEGDAWWNEAYWAPDLARDMHDYLLANMMAGWLPPLRPKVLRTLKAPQYSGRPCTHPSCRIKGCFGNTLMWLDHAHTRLGFK